MINSKESCREKSVAYLESLGDEHIIILTREKVVLVCT